MRIHKEHAVTIKYLWNRRDATCSDLANQSADARDFRHLLHALLGHQHFSARPALGRLAAVRCWPLLFQPGDNAVIVIEPAKK